MDPAISPGSVFVFPGDEPAESIRRELRDAQLCLYEPANFESATQLLPTLDPDLLLIESTSNVGRVAEAIATLERRRSDLPPILVLAGYAMRPLEAKLLYEVGVTDVVFPPHHPSLTLAKIGALLRFKRRLDAARELSVRDELTGLYNRRYLLERLEQEVARTVRTGQGLALVLFDLDHFKKINDSFGHPTGDAVLRSLATVAAKHTRKSDIAARLGGDEFVLLLSSNTIEGAFICAEGLRLKLHEADLRLPTGARLTASFGVAVYPHPTVQHPMEDLFHEADQALLRAKARGRDCVESIPDPT